MGGLIATNLNILSTITQEISFRNIDPQAVFQPYSTLATSFHDLSPKAEHAALRTTTAHDVAALTEISDIPQRREGLLPEKATNLLQEHEQGRIVIQVTASCQAKVIQEPFI